MSTEVVLQQMIIIFILILIGILLYRKAMLSDNTSKQISGLIVNLCNPALLISSVFTDEPKVSANELLTAAFIIILAYTILIICSYLVPHILHVQREEHFAYRLITIYGNVGFIGIPLSLAVLGPGSLIYVSLNNLVYNILIYTHGIGTIKKAAGIQKEKTEGFASHLMLLTKKFINVGTVSALLTIVLYLCDFKVPALLPNTLTYIGSCTTFLSMLVLGVSTAQMPLKDIFSNPKLYIFAALRLILIPAVCLFLFRFFTDNILIISTTAIMLALPSGNMPLIFSNQYDLDCPTISKGIILSTLLSLITIPIVTLILQSVL